MVLLISVGYCITCSTSEMFLANERIINLNLCTKTSLFEKGDHITRLMYVFQSLPEDEETAIPEVKENCTNDHCKLGCVCDSLLCQRKSELCIPFINGCSFYFVSSHCSDCDRFMKTMWRQIGTLCTIFSLLMILVLVNRAISFYEKLRLMN